jgi:hypothetical protein
VLFRYTRTGRFVVAKSTIDKTKIVECVGQVGILGIFIVHVSLHENAKNTDLASTLNNLGVDQF